MVITPGFSFPWIRGFNQCFLYPRLPLERPAEAERGPILIFTASMVLSGLGCISLGGAANTYRKVLSWPAFTLGLTRRAGADGNACNAQMGGADGTMSNRLRKI